MVAVQTTDDGPAVVTPVIVTGCIIDVVFATAFTFCNHEKKNKRLANTKYQSRECQPNGWMILLDG
ncbi:hypothetical protein DERF_000248 [Dermatophagoides farinae]|uniref:Uncharacterized protein n=1 Tax=Dermatophagoides farinae TaxID=6954 RepID=A0A922I9S3_DERFA|nr:hypothetical protein DERF_000248 [Dermatophagoides farinae]